MAGRVLRGAIVGASTLLGKELAEVLSTSAGLTWDLTLLDAGDAGQVVAAGDEAMVILAVESTSFAGMDVAFFAGDAATTRSYWRDAQAAGASVVDLSGALEKELGVLVGAAMGGLGFGADAKPDLATTVVACAHPAGVMLAMVAKRIAKLGPAMMAATVMEPASQQGSAGVDELQQQTVALLTFQSLPQDVYDAQVAFALRDEVGGAAKVHLATTAETIRRHMRLLSAETGTVALQLVQAPVFHGYTASMWVRFASAVPVSALTQALEGDGVRVENDDVSNQNAVAQDDVLLRVQPEGDGFWLWMAVDNLRMSAQVAAACAAELAVLRPAGTVQ